MESTAAISSLIFGGVLEKFPKLKVCVAHGGWPMKLIIAFLFYLKLNWRIIFSGGSFPYTLGRLEHGYHAIPELCAMKCSSSPKSFIGNIYFDSLVHDEKALKFLVETMGEVVLILLIAEFAINLDFCTTIRTRSCLGVTTLSGLENKFLELWSNPRT